MARLVPKSAWSFVLPFHDNVVIKSLRHFDVRADVQNVERDRRIPRLQAFQRELRVLTHTPLRNHENIVKLLGVGWERNRSDISSPVFHWPLLVQEYASYGSMIDFLETNEVGFDDRLRLCVDVGKGLAALHACDITHADVKPENVLIFPHSQKKFVAKISDFGLSLFNLGGKSTSTRELGRTEPWNAPESGHLLSWRDRKLTDVYTYGFLIWRVMAYGHAPFDQSRGSLSKKSELMIKAAKQQDEVPLKMRRSLAACIGDSALLGKLYSVAELTVQLDRSKRQLIKAVDVLTQSLTTASYNSLRTSLKQSISTSTPLRDNTIPYEVY
jgi:serine/threonine protein kinase